MWSITYSFYKCVQMLFLVMAVCNPMQLTLDGKTIIELSYAYGPIA
jgi:hypothetical protein